jgi:hypothetical protein
MPQVDISKVQWDAAPAIDPSTIQWDAPQTGIPGPRQSPGFMTQLGRGMASLGDVTIGGILPGIAQQVAYPFARLGRSPEEAQAVTQRITGAIGQPFGKAFGVTETPEYKQETGRQLLDFVGQNFQKGAKWIAEKTGEPQADIESYMGSLTVAAPKVASAVAPYIAPYAEQAAIGAKMPFEGRAQARRERLSAEDYARGPQIDAAAEAQRLKIALNPADISPSASARFLSAAAGPRGPEALALANKPRVTEIAKNELGLDSTVSLTSDLPFKDARAKLAAPYDEVRGLPTMVADETALKNLNDLRRNEKLIGGEGVAKKVNKLVDDAVTKTQAGFTGAELLDNVRTLRADAKKIYNNQNATPKQIAVADANLAIANQLESMIESNISNPKLLSQFRDARQKMARTYVYESATDFNTGMVDVSKLARITAKDNALTGDIASLGKIAGNFPDVFTAQAASKFYDLPRLSRSGLAGGGGALIGSQFGLTGSIVGGLLGGGLGEIGGAAAANRLASPAYQAGLKLRDMRIPVNQMAGAQQPIPRENALVPYEPEVLNAMPGASNASKLRIVSYDENGVPIYAAAERSRQGFTMPPSPSFGAAPAPFAQRSLPNEVPRQIYEAQKNAELAQEFRATAERKPTGAGVQYDLDPITGRLVETSAGVKGATPEIWQADTGASLKSATEKIASGQRFDLSAAEKVAWDKTRVDLAAVAPEFKSLSQKQLSEKMMDRQWVADAITKVQDKQRAFDNIAQRAQSADAIRKATIAREQMTDLLTTLEETFRQQRPVSSTAQGPKTRAAQRNQLRPVTIELNNMARPDKP